MPTFPAWLPFALGSAFFAGLKAVLGKVGVASINSNLATFIRTVVILAVIASILSFRWEWRALRRSFTVGWYFWFSLPSRPGSRGCVTTERYNLAPASMVAPIDKLSVAFAIVAGGHVPW